jgi:diguanylate cyclase (GGDEF)-like protein
MEVKYYLRTLSQGWWLILLTMFIALEAALVSDYLMTPTYRASVTFALSPNTTQMSSSSDVLNSLDTLDKRSVVTTYAEFLNSERIYEETLKNLNIDVAALKRYTRSTVVIPDSNVLELTIEGTDPNTVAILANNVGEHAISEIKKLYNAYDINMLDPAVPSKSPIRPVPLRDAGLALVLGLAVGAGLAILRGQVGTTLDTFRQRSNRDKVSLAYNRSYLEKRLDQELVHNPDGNLSFGLVQLDGLRGLYENLSPNLVQDLMRLVVESLQKELRGNDMICRWDDITFAILLPTTPATAAQLTINRICIPISQPIFLKMYNEKVDLQPTLCVTTSQKNETANQLVTRAESMLKSVVGVQISPKAQIQSDGKAN